MNFHGHAREQGQEPPKEPVLFMKATTALCGPNDDLVLPRGSVKTDWEVELAVVIGKRASYVEKAQRPGPRGRVRRCTTTTPSASTSWSAAASGTRARAATPSRRWARSWSPATRSTPRNLDMWLKVNGETVQRGNTSDLIFDVPTLVSYISAFMTLLPGDVISTGTPSGRGLLHEAAALPEGRRRGRAGHRGPGQLPPARGRALTDHRPGGRLPEARALMPAGGSASE